VKTYSIMYKLALYTTSFGFLFLLSKSFQDKCHWSVVYRYIRQ